MSYSILYNSFNPDVANQKWTDFDIAINDALKKCKKINDLEAMGGSFSEFRVSDIDEELIYNPKLKSEYDKKRSETMQEIRNAQEELRMLKDKNPVYQAEILYYIENQEPIEPEMAIQYMADLDLLWGGKRASFISSMDSVIPIGVTLGILFPETGPKELEELTTDDWMIIFKHFDEVDGRFESHKNEFLQDKDHFDISNEKELARWKDEFKNQLAKLSPVLEDVAEHKAQLFIWIDSMGYPESLALEDRARKHIEELKNNFRMKIPLQDYPK